MKKFVLFPLVVALTLIAHAQSTIPEVEQKIAQMGNAVDSLKSTLVVLQSSMAKMQAKVDEVTKQNLALKQAISLQPTIAEAKTEDGLDFRLIEAKGDLKTGEVTFVISIANTADNDINLQCSNVIAVDINGQQYKEPDQFEKAHIGETHINSITTLIPDAPLEMLLSFRPKSEIPYIKVLDMEAYGGHSFRFTNIPIKWE